MLRSSRTIYAALGIGCFVAAIALTPGEVRGTLGVVRTVSPSQAPIPQPVRPIAPQRDPFIPRAGDDISTPPPRQPLTPAPLPFSLAGIGPLPPNAGAPAMNAPLFPALARARVLAVVTGPQPSALVDANGTTRLCFVGDALDGSVIHAIDPDGVTLADGHHLMIVTGSEFKP